MFLYHIIHNIILLLKISVTVTEAIMWLRGGHVHQLSELQFQAPSGLFLRLPYN